MAIATSVSAGGVANAGAVAGSPSDGWVVENPRADNLFDTTAGSATIVDSTTGATIACSAVEGIGRADSGTIRPNDWFGSTVMTAYSSCTGPGTPDAEVFSPEIRLAPTSYDPATDIVTGFGIVDIWGLFPTTPTCDVTLYPTDPLVEVPMTYDNGTKTVELGPVTTAVYEATGADCSAFPAEGQEMTFSTTLVASPGFTVRPA
jgi:hypothetical protein